MKNMIMTIPEPSLKRLHNYVYIIKKLIETKSDYISASDIARELSILPVKVRKDLKYTGIIGYPKKGYDAIELLDKIEHFLGWKVKDEAFLVGCGHLGKALLGYTGFKDIGVSIIAGFDIKKSLIGTEIYGTKIFNINKLPSLIKRMKTKIGIITTNPETSQSVADIMINSGIKAILNFTPQKLNFNENIIIQNVNFISNFTVLNKKLELFEKKGGFIS